MTDILKALKECAETPNATLTRHECLHAYGFILGLIEQRDHALKANNEIAHNYFELASKQPKQDSPTVNAIKWAGRWLAAIVAAGSLALIMETWENVPLYWVCLMTVFTIGTHAVGMLFEWWHK